MNIQGYLLSSSVKVRKWERTRISSQGHSPALVLDHMKDITGSLSLEQACKTKQYVKFGFNSPSNVMISISAATKTPKTLGIK